MKNKGMQIMLSIVVAFCLCIVLIQNSMSVCASESNVSDTLDLSHPNTLVVDVNEDISHYLDRLSEADGTLVYDLYKIADISAYENAISFEINPAYGYLSEALERVSKSGQKKDDTITYRSFAQLAMQKILGEDGTVLQTPDHADYEGLPLGQRNNIDAGLYMLIVRGTETDSTMIKSVSLSNADQNSTSIQNELATYTLLGSTYFTASPLMICAPTKMTETGDVVQSASKEGKWIYDQSVILKMNADPAAGSITINKKLTGYYKNLENTIFVFRVDTYFPTDDQLYSSEVYSLQFDSQDTKSLVINGFPIGSRVVVTEIYTGLDYSLAIDSPETVEVRITEDDLQTVDFQNEYNGNTGTGGGITNHFSYVESEEDGRWTWEQVKDNMNTINGKISRIMNKVLDAAKNIFN